MYTSVVEYLIALLEALGSILNVNMGINLYIDQGLVI